MLKQSPPGAEPAGPDSSQPIPSPGDRPDDKQRLLPRRHRLRQRRVRRIVGQILLAGEQAQGRPSYLGDVIANRAAQHGIARLQHVQDRPLRGRTIDLPRPLRLDLRQVSPMVRQHDSYQSSAWTSPDSTAGRFRAMGAQLSPPPGEAYTCPPVVPKYTPHGSSEPTAIASPRP